MRWILDACTLIYLVKAKIFNSFMHVVSNPVVIDSSVFQEVIIEGKEHKYLDAFEAESLLNEFHIPVISINVSNELYRFVDPGETSCYILAKEEGICITSDDRAYRKFHQTNLDVMRIDSFFYLKFRDNKITKIEFLEILKKLESINATKPKSVLFYMQKIQNTKED
jgi:predicted nucleic acid-binding protein